MEQFTILVVAGGVVAILAVLVYGLSKIRTFQRHMYRSIDERIPQLLTRELNTQLHTHFRQVEALTGLFLELGITRSLPATRGWAASPDFLHEIALHALHARPKVIAECGSGVSTVVLARCLQMNRTGHVYSLEHLAQHAEKTRGTRTTGSSGLGDRTDRAPCVLTNYPEKHIPGTRPSSFHLSDWTCW